MQRTHSLQRRTAHTQLRCHVGCKIDLREPPRFLARHIHPPDLERLMASIGTPDAELRAARARQGEWPQHLAGMGAALEASGEAALAAFAGLREVGDEDWHVTADALALAARVAAEQGLYDGGYRVITNDGPDAGQTVWHLHFHVLGGAKLQAGLG